MVAYILLDGKHTFLFAVCNCAEACVEAFVLPKPKVKVETFARLIKILLHRFMWDKAAQILPIESCELFDSFLSFETSFF